MSANNFVLIRKKKEGSYFIQECDAENGLTISEVGFGDTLEEAVKKANAYMQNTEVEYGLEVDI